MAFITKEWKDRIVEYAGRRRLTNVSTQAQEIVDVERAEGTVSQAGDAFSAANMNDLEQRISDEFTAVNENLNAITDNGNITNVRINPNDSNALQWSSDGGSEWHDFFSQDYSHDVNSGVSEHYFPQDGLFIIFGYQQDTSQTWYAPVLTTTGESLHNGVVIDLPNRAGFLKFWTVKARSTDTYRVTNPHQGTTYFASHLLY